MRYGDAPGAGGHSAVPELKPLERREAARRSASPYSKGCFSIGCNVCTVDEHDLARHGVTRLNDIWDITNLGSREEVDDTSSVEDLDLGSMVVPSTRSPSSQSGGHMSGMLPKGTLVCEVEAIIQEIDEVMALQGLSIRHVAGDRYNINARNVRLGFLKQGVTTPDCSHTMMHFDREVCRRMARIVVHDGPLRQPLGDYLLQTGKNEAYDTRGTGSTPLAKHLEFNVAASSDRVEEMRLGAWQADVRRRAAHSPGPPRSMSGGHGGMSPQEVHVFAGGGSGHHPAYHRVVQA